MTSFRDRLRARQLPTTVVPLAGPAPSDPTEYLLLRALEPDAWELLVEAHPPTDVQRDQGHAWDRRTFEPALIAESVIATMSLPAQDRPDLEVVQKQLLALAAAGGEPDLSADDFVDAAARGFLTVGQLLVLWETALQLNDGTEAFNRQVAELGKDSAATPGSRQG